MGSNPADYKGVALATVSGHTYLYVANFYSGTIDILKGDAATPDLSGHFVDPTLPSGYAPSNIELLGGKLYVTYAKPDSSMDLQAGPGLGIVDVFDTQGNFVARVGTESTLNAPWGLAIAPPSFGSFAGDLLVGNFGDGAVHKITFFPDGRVKDNTVWAKDPAQLQTTDGMIMDQHGNCTSPTFPPTPSVW